MQRVAIYAGSFNPFHNGHQNIVDRASKVFDEVHVVRLLPTDKTPNEKYDNNPKFKQNNVKFHERKGMLLVDVCKEFNANYMVRSMRNGVDFEYERNMFEYNKYLDADVECVFFMADKRYSHVSSTLIRECDKYNRNWDNLINEVNL